MRPQVGQVINNKYRLVRVIGEGGMGSVYEARHEMLGTTVALKFLHPELGRRAGLVQRFLQEARVSAQIQSPHVVRVSDVDQTADGLAFMVMEYVEGKTLQTLYEELYQAGQRLSYADALEYAMQMVEGVDAAHRAGVVHRDLKPDNVIITKGPKGAPLIKLLDFGIAKLKVTGELERGLTRPGVMMGTPEYMAPEQAFSADTADARADVFSLGVIIFEMLAGRRPVGGDDPHQIAAQYVTGQVASLVDLAPWVPAQLAAVIHHAMAAKPDDRLGSIAELRTALEPFALAAQTPLPTATPAVSHPEASADGMPRTVAPEAQAGGRVGPGTPLGGMAVGGAAFASTNPGQSAQGVALDAGHAPGSAGDAPAGARPGGTALGAPMFAEPVMGRTGVEHAPRPGTVPAAAMPLDRSFAQPPPRPSRSGASALLMILLLASGVAAVVVGGVFVAQRYAKAGDNHDDVPVVALPPQTSVPSEPPAPVPPAGTVYVPPPALTTAAPPPTRPGPAPVGPPGPVPTSHPTTTTRPTPILPSALPPFTLPSGLPGFPGLPPIFQPGTPGGTQTPPTQPGGGTPPGGGTNPGSQPQPTGGATSTPTSPPARPRPPLSIPPRRLVPAQGDSRGPAPHRP